MSDSKFSRNFLKTLVNRVLWDVFSAKTACSESMFKRNELTATRNISIAMSGADNGIGGDNVN